MSTEPASGPTGPARTRRLGPAAAVASAIAIGLASWFAWPRLQAWTAERRAKSAFEETAKCLSLGAETTDDVLRDRMIAAELAGDEWPTPCAQHLVSLSAGAAVARQPHLACEGGCCVGDARCVALDRLVTHAGKLKEQARRGHFADGAGRALVEAGVSLGWQLPTSEASSAHAGHLSADAVPPLANGPLVRSALCRMGVPAWWLMVHHAERGGTLCELRISEATARCAPLPTAVPAGGEVYLVDGGLAKGPRVLAASEDGWGLYRPSGERAATLPRATVGVSTTAAEGVAALVERDDAFEVLVDGEPRFDVDATSPPLLYGGYVVAQRGKELYARSLDTGERVALGTLKSHARVTMRGCVSSGVTAVRVRDDERETDVLAAKRGGEWSFIELPEGLPPQSLSCHGEDAHFVWLDGTGGRHRAHDVACGPSGCRERSGEITIRRYSPRSRFFIAALGPDVAVIWRSLHGDVRARIGPPDELETRADFPVVEDAEHGGFAWDTAPLRVLSAEGAALVLIEREGSVHGVMLDGQGARPVRTRN